MSVANGYVPSSELVTVQGSMQLQHNAADAYNAMKSAARGAGVTLTIAEPAGAYRSFAVQQDMHDNPGRYNLSTSSKIPLAAAGHSTHGFGTAFDVGTRAANDWTISNCGRFSFYREFGNDDPNHYRYTGPIDSAPPPAPSQRTYYHEDTELERHRFETTNPSTVLHDFLIGPGARVRRLSDPAFFNDHYSQGGLVIHHVNPGTPPVNGGPNPLTTVAYVMSGLVGLDSNTLNTMTSRGDAEAVRQANGQWTVL